jgi:membrane protein YqaA with SNARE-associated domain
MGSMSGALTNYLLGLLVMKASNPVPVMGKEHFKRISEKTIDGVIEIVSDKGCQLTKVELAALQELANSYKETFKLFA